MSQAPPIRQAVVLGAGVMGSQIAALLANAGIDVDLLDLPGDDGPDARAAAGKARAEKGRAFFDAASAARVRPGSLEDLEPVRRAGWVIEAIVEESAAKRALYARLEPLLAPDAVCSTNTSGLRIAELSAGLSAEFGRRFMGIHFFNPPRAMHLVECIAGPHTDPALFQAMQAVVQERLGKGPVVCRDTPNFIGNRLGVFALMDVLHRFAGRQAEEIDALTGPLLGRPRSATLRLADLIGLDILADVAQTGYRCLPDDPWRAVFAIPEPVQAMLQKGLLGAKSGSGFYRKTAAGIEALDWENFVYRPLRPYEGTLLKAARSRAWQDRLRAVWTDTDPQNAWLRQHLLQVLLYAAHHAEEIADSLEAVDLAMRWGFNWEAGPFQIWDALGADQVQAAVEAAGHAVPPLAQRVAATGAGCFYAEGKVFSPGVGRYLPRRDDRSLPPPEQALWRADGAYAAEWGEGIGVLVLDGKLNVIGLQVLEAIRRILDEERFDGVVLTGAGGQFSAGADLKYMAGLVATGDWDGLEAFVLAFQQTAMALRQAKRPVVAAMRGLALGGGCEFALACAGRVVAAETRVGLVESRVGLIPAGGGCKELLRRADGDLAGPFAAVLAGDMSDNAYPAKAWGLLAPEDTVLMRADAVVDRAAAEARQRAADFSPVALAKIEVPGAAGMAPLQAVIDAHKDFSDHDRSVALALARVLCGGDGPARQVDEWHVLDLEREAFVGLCGTPLTQARIEHMLKTGKPLRN